MGTYEIFKKRYAKEQTEKPASSASKRAVNAETKKAETAEPVKQSSGNRSLDYFYKHTKAPEPVKANALEDLSASVTPAVNKPKNLFNDDFTKNALKYMETHPNGNPYTAGINNNPQPARPLSGDTKSPEFQSLVEMSKKVDANNAKTVKSKEQYEREAAIAKAVSPKLVYDSTIQNGMRGDRIAEDRFRTSARANSQLAGAANATRQGDALKTDVYNSAAVFENDALKNYKLTQSELETYYYISGVHGKEEGERYLNRVRDSRINPEIAEKAYSDIAETRGIPGAIGRLGVSFGAGLSSSANSLAAIPQLMEGGTDVPPRSVAENMGALVQQDPNNKIKTATEIAQSFGTNLPSQATGLVLGPTAGSTVLALQMGAGAYREAINEGRNVGEARMFGTLQGVDEYVTNQLLNGTTALGGSVLQRTLKNTKAFTAAKAGLRSMFTTPTMRTVVGWGMDQLASMSSEAAQEFLQYFTEELERYIAFGESDMDLSDPKTWEEAAHAGWVGALNALAMNVPATAMQGVGTYNAGKYAGMGYQDIADSIRPTAAQYTDQNIRDSARNVFDMARDFQTKEAEGKKVSFFDRGLFEAAAEDYNNAVLNYNRDHARPVYEEAFRTEETAPEEAAPVEDTATAENVASETTNRESANDYIKRRQAENTARQAATQAMNDVASETAKDTGEAFRNANYYNSQRMTPGERIFNAEMSQDMASTFGEEGRNAFSALPAEEGVKAYREWASHYNNMRFGIPLNPNAESRLSPEQISAAMRAGALDANRAYPQDTMKAMNRSVSKIKVNGVNAGVADRSGINYNSLTPQQKLRVDYTEAFVTKGLGMDVRYVQSDAVDGKYRGMNGSFQVINGRPTMTLDVNAGMNRESDWTGDITDIKTMLPVISHETTHFLEQYNPKLYKELSSTVLAALQNSGSYSKGMTINSIIEAERKRLNDTIRDENGNPVQHTQEDAIHELVARACEDMLSGDKKALDAFNSLDSQTKQTLWDHVKQVFDNIREFFSQMLSSYKSDSAEAKAIRQNMEEFEKIRDLWDEALNSERVVPASDITSSQKSTANTGAGEFSVRQFAQALDFDVRINREGQAFEIIDPHTGKAIKHVTEEMMEQTPMGFMVRSAQNAGTIDQKTADKQIKMFKDLMNLTLRYDQGTTPMVWEIAGSFLFSSVKTNADKQYSTTVDYGTICSKTQALIDVLSKTMVEKGRGLTREEVLKAYNKTANTGLSVPCPVCYVFSRWMGVPSLLETMRKCQERFGNASEQEVQSYIQTMLDQYGDAKGVNSEKTKVQNRLATLERRLQEAVSKNDLAAQADIQKEVRSLEKKMSDLESFNWVTQVRCVKSKNGKYTLDRKYRSVPNDVLLDLRRSGDFAQKYPKSWKYRTTRGAGMGKAIMPYSGATIGDFIKGTKDRWVDAKNPFYSKNTKAARSAISRAQARAKAQNLIGGQRFQSTSDFRAEWGIDYLMTFLECQLANSQVQLYTKVIEAVDMFASAGAEVNLSIMPRDNGYVNGKLVFSDVTGVNFNDALRKTRKYDNVQMILVGINDDHIRLAMADDRISFIIPWHSSGNSKDTLASLMKSVGETLNNASDYSETQNDKVIDNSDGMKAVRKFRKDIIQGKLWENYKNKTVKALTAEQQSMLDGNQYLSDLYRRFYQDASAKEYGVRLNGNQSSSIFPYEYWDTSLTVKDADRNGRRFQEYCASLGIQPRFSQFANDTGYWKLLIDRRMYNRDGTYHDPKAIDVTNVKVSQVPQAVNSNNYKDMSKINQATLDTIRAIDETQNDLAVTEDATPMISDDIKPQYSARDTEYMNAVRSNDMGTAGRMVRDAAKDIETIAKDAKGNPIHLYHGTPNFGFTVFEDRRHSTPFIYTSTKSEVSAHYAGDDNYAFPRKIGTRYRNGNSTNDIIENARNVYGVEYRVMTVDEKERKYNEIREQAVKIADKIDALFPSSLNLSEELANDVQWVAMPFWEFRDYDDQYNFHEDDGYRDEWKQILQNDVERYEDSRKRVREYYDDNYSNLADDEKKYLRYLLGYEVGDAAIDIQYGAMRVMTDDDVLIDDSGRTASPKALKRDMDKIHEIGAYDLYGDLGKNPYEIDTNGAQFWAIKVPDMGDGYYSTDELSKWALQNGYTSVIMRNIYDYGDKADNYVFFDSSQLKSADPITYDDDGNVIPLSERFNSENSDIRYSTRDSSGRDLTTAQAEYFRDSKARDAEGRLLTLYHGTASAGFTEFRGSVWLTTSKRDADSYGGNWEGKAFDPDEKPEVRKTTGKTYPVGEHMRFESKEDRDAFLKSYPDAESYLTEREYIQRQGELDSDLDADDYDERSDELQRLRRRSEQIERAYVRYERNHSASTTIGAMLEEPSLYSLNDFKRAWTSIDREASFDDEFDNYDSDEEYRDALADRLRKYITEENADDPKWQDEMLSLPVKARIPDGRQGEIFNSTNNRTYELYANVVNPFVFDNHGRGSEGNGTFHRNIEKAMADPQYDGVIALNARVGRHQDLGTVVVAKSSDQVKLVSNQNPTADNDIRRSQRDVDIDARIDALVKKYGAMPTGEHPQRSEQLPKQTSDGKNLRRFARTVWESGITTDDIDNEIKKAIIDESLSYEVKTDEEAAEYASSVIRIGGVERAQKEWDKARRSDTFNKDHMALGQFLLKEYAKKNDVENAMKMIQELAAEGTRMGQNIQAMRMLKKYSQKVPAIGLGYIQRTVDQMNRDAKRKMGKKFQKMEIDQKLADAYLNAKTQDEIDSAIADIYIDLGSQVQKTTTEDVVDRLRTWRYMAMLGNPRTHIRNLVGNALFVPAVQMKNAIGAGLEGTMKTKTRTKAVRVSKEAAAFAKQDAIEMRDRLSGRQDLSIRDLIMEQRKVFSSKALNTLSEKNSQALEAEDWIFLRRHYENSLAQYITANKLDTTQENPAWLGKAREYAVLEAQKATYRDANKVSAWLNQSGKAGTVVKYMMEGMLPFKKTPTNILRRGVEYSPAGLVATLTKGTRDLNTGKITVNEWIDGVSAGLTGTAIFGLGMFLASTGAILGGYDDDDDKELRKLKGLQEYSVRIGNKTYTIDWAAPGSLPLFIGVETMSALQSERGVTMDDMGKSVMRMIDPMINMSMLSGLNDTLDAISYSENKLSAAAMETFYSLLGQYVPTLFGQVARTIDTTQRINYQDKNKGMSKDMLYFIEKMQNKIPFLTFSNDPYLNEFGQENDSGPHWAAALQNFVSPGYISSVKDDKVINEIERLQEAQEENVLPKKMPKYLGTKENRVDLTSEQYTLFQRTAGQTAYNILDRMIADRRYDRMNADEQAAAIKMAYDYAKAVGRIAVQPEYESELKGDTKKIYNAVKDRKQAFSAILDLCAEKKEKKKSK